MVVCHKVEATGRTHDPLPTIGPKHNWFLLRRTSGVLTALSADVFCPLTHLVGRKGMVVGAKERVSGGRHAVGGVQRFRCG